jgi:uncharacterized membrane protein
VTAVYVRDVAATAEEEDMIRAASVVMLVTAALVRDVTAAPQDNTVSTVILAINCRAGHWH